MSGKFRLIQVATRTAGALSAEAVNVATVLRGRNHGLIATLLNEIQRTRHLLGLPAIWPSNDLRILTGGCARGRG